MSRDPMQSQVEKQLSQHEVPYLRGVPEPTGAPMISAFGLTLLFMGLITSRAVMAVGIICLVVGLIGWIKVVFPNESLEELPSGSEIPDPAPQFAARPEVARVSLPEHIHPYGAGVWGGLIGGISMAAVAVAWGLIKEKLQMLPV